MLLSYSIKNWKSIKEKITLDLRAKSIKDHIQNKNHLLDGNILPISVIYGPNGGGKSSIMESISFFVNDILKNFLYRKDLLTNNNYLENISFLLKHIKNVKTKYEPIDLEFNFLRNDGSIFNYQISIQNSINNKFNFSYEKLSIYKNKKEIRLLKMEKNQTSFFNNLAFAPIDKLKNFGPHIPLIFSLYDSYDYKEIKELIEEHFLNIQTIHNVTLSEQIDPDTKYIAKGFNFNAYYIATEIKEIFDEYKKEFLGVIKKIDSNIVDIRIDDLGTKEYSIYIARRFEFGEIKEIPFILESYGFREIFILLLMFLSGTKKNSIFVVDELDSHLHTKVLRYLIGLFTNQKGTKSQLIYTSHDTPTLDKNLFRRDEIYFVELNESNFTDLVSLYDFGKSIRNNQSYEKQYLDEKIGFIPYIDYSEDENSNKNRI